MTLGEIAHGGTFSDGDWVESKDQDPAGSVRLTQLADVGVAHFRNRSDRWLREDQASRLNCTFLEPRDVLIARMPDPIGRACLVPPMLGRAVTAVDVAVLRIGRDDVVPGYAMWAINSPTFRGEVEGLQSGTTRKRISRRNLASLTIPVPAVDEQRRIVDILEDHLSRLDAADAYLFSGERRLVGLRRAALALHFSDSHHTVGLVDLVSKVEAGRSFGAASAPAGPDEWGIVKVSAMTWGQFRPEENKAVPSDQADSRYEIRSGDLLVSRANTSDYVGASVLVGDVRSRLLLSDKSLRLVARPDVRPEWLWRALQSPIARKQISSLATGTKDSMRNISQKALLSVQLPALSLGSQDEALQAYLEATSQIGPLELAIANARLRCKSTRRALLKAAFSGKLTGRHTDEESATVANERAVVGAG